MSALDSCLRRHWMRLGGIDQQIEFSWLADGSANWQLSITPAPKHHCVYPMSGDTGPENASELPEFVDGPDVVEAGTSSGCCSAWYNLKADKLGTDNAEEKDTMLLLSMARGILYIALIIFFVTAFNEMDSDEYNFKVTVVGGAYVMTLVESPNTNYNVAGTVLTLQKGNTYIFDQSDASNSGSPIQFYGTGSLSDRDYATTEDTTNMIFKVPTAGVQEVVYRASEGSTTGGTVSLQDRTKVNFASFDLSIDAALSLLLTFVLFIYGVFVTPLAAILDYSDKRNAALYAVTIGMGVFFFIATQFMWFTDNHAIIFVFAVPTWLFLELCFTVWMSYVPEVAPGRETAMSAFAQLYNLTAQLSLIFVFVPLGLVMPRTFSFHYNLCVCLFAVILYFIFYVVFIMGKFKPRTASHVLPEGQWLMTVGLVQVGKTWQRRHEFTQMGILLICFSLAQTAFMSFIGNIVNFLENGLLLATIHVGAITFLFMLSGVVAVFVVNKYKAQVGEKNLMLGAWITMLAGYMIIALFISEDSSVIFMYILTFFLGTAGTVHIVVPRGVFAQLMPAGQNSEFAGVFSFSEKTFTWVGPMTYFVMLSQDYSHQSAVGATASFLFFAIGIMIFFFSLEKGQAQANAASIASKEDVAVEMNSVGTEPSSNESAISGRSVGSV